MCLLKSINSIIWQVFTLGVLLIYHRITNFSIIYNCFRIHYLLHSLMKIISLFLLIKVSENNRWIYIHKFKKLVGEKVTWEKVIRGNININLYISFIVYELLLSPHIKNYWHLTSKYKLYLRWWKILSWISIISSKTRQRFYGMNDKIFLIFNLKSRCSIKNLFFKGRLTLDSEISYIYIWKIIVWIS